MKRLFFFIITYIIYIFLILSFLNSKKHTKQLNGHEMNFISNEFKKQNDDEITRIKNN